MSQFVLAEFKACVQRLNDRLQEAITFINEKKHQTEPENIELLVHHLSNNVRRVRNAMDKTEQDQLDKSVCISTCDILLNAEDYLLELNVHMHKYQQRTALPTPQQSTVQPVAQQFKQLEVTVPTFDGTRSKYHGFKKAIEIICNRKQASPEEKLLFLIQHVGKGPAKALENIPYTEQGYNLAWSILDEEYSDAARIRNDIFNQLTRMQPATDEPSSLKDTLDEIESLLRILETYQDADDEVNNNETYRRLVLAKFPRSIIRHITPLGQVLTLKDARKNLRTAIRSEIDVQLLVEPINTISVTENLASSQIQITAPLLAASGELEQKNTTSKKIERSPKNDNQQNKGKDKPVPNCAFCSKKHYSSDCKTYDTAEARKNALPTDSCIICLRTGHSRQRCYSKGRCYSCKSRNHHSAFCPTKFGHFTRSENKTNNKAPANQEEKKTPQTPTSPRKSTSVALLRTHKSTHITALAYVRNPVTNKTLSARIILDCAAPDSFILESTASALELTSHDKHELQVFVFGSKEYRRLQSNTVQFELLVPGQRPVNIFADTTPLIQEEIQVFDIEDFKNRYPKFANYKFANPADGEPIQVLIGNDYLFECLNFSSQIEISRGLYIVESTFGWHITGRMEKDHSRNSIAATSVMLSTKKAITSLWTLDAIGITDNDHSKTKEEEIALQEFEQNVCYENGRYSVTFPWKHQPTELPNNYALSRGILSSVLKRYAGTEYLQICDSIFQQQLADGIIEEAQQLPQGATAHYLPFHFVPQPGKSMKIRIVYNGSAKTAKQQLSLNDCLYKGTNLLSEIPQLILRFRTRRTAVVADIQAAYHTLSIQEHERDLLRFLWIRNFADPPEKHEITLYRFARVPFGVVTGAFLLAATIHHHLQQYNNTVSRQLLNDIYVDNLITGADSTQSAISLLKEAVNIFDTASMNLRQWNSNDSVFLRNVPTNLKDENTETKILGLPWDTKTDTFRLSAPKKFDFQRPTTLRRVLKSTSQGFDPIGWATPITITARILIQKLHEAKYEWDTPVKQEHAAQWKDIFNELQQLDTITVPRFISSYNPSSATYSYHAFADASKLAYACAIYLRIEDKEKISTHLLYARARVAPIKQLSIPRLELMAAVIAVRAMKYVRTALPFPTTESHIWIDSKCILFWIKNGTNVPRFVKNRLNEIRGVDNVTFRYVRSAQNSADIPSRGCTISELRRNETWWSGPKWLSQAENNWPAPWSPEDAQNAVILATTAYEMEEAITSAVTLTQTTPPRTPFDIEVNRFKTHRALLRTTAYCIAFLRKTSICRRKKIFQLEKISPVSHANLLWVRAVQEHAYQREINLIKDGKANSTIRRLRLFIDDQNILRAAGRLQNAPLPYHEKNPILLPHTREHPFVRLIILASHDAVMHAGTNHTLTHVRKKYWLPSGRRNVYNIIKECMVCKKERARPFQQPQNSDLPKFRLSDECYPFQHIGIDIAGHFWLHQSKCWIFIATCLNTRAVALEVLRDLTTPTVYNAFARIAARRSAADFVLSDNAPQFILLKQEIERHRDESFTWKFITPHAPHEGGVYERLIALVKTTLYRTLRQSVVSTHDHFQTIIYQIEAVMNQRPITYIANEPGIQPLTPGDFIRTRLPESKEDEQTRPASEAAAILRTAYQQQQHVHQQFQSIWRREYLQYLRERTAHQRFKAATTTRPPQVGDIVLVEETNTQRKHWKLARIIQLQRSNDGQIRSAVVQLASRTKIIRPIERLYDLELNDNQSN